MWAEAGCWERFFSFYYILDQSRLIPESIAASEIFHWEANFTKMIYTPLNTFKVLQKINRKLQTSIEIKFGVKNILKKYLLKITWKYTKTYATKKCKARAPRAMLPNLSIIS
jgi:hypothetical protein